MKNGLIPALIVLGLLTPLVFTGCSNAQDTAISEGFAIYLTKDNIPVSQMPILSHIEIGNTPLISLNDFYYYNVNTHEVNLTSEAYVRIMDLDVPTTGRAFVVCVDKHAIYWGAFWTPISSQSFDGVTILVEPIPSGDRIKIGLGYPSENFFKGEDPRSNPEILKSLSEAHKG